MITHSKQEIAEGILIKMLGHGVYTLPVYTRLCPEKHSTVYRHIEAKISGELITFVAKKHFLVKFITNQKGTSACHKNLNPCTRIVGWVSIIHPQTKLCHAFKQTGLNRGLKIIIENL